MSKHAIAVTAALLVVVAAVPVAGLAATAGEPTGTQNESSGDLAPGQRLSGVVGVQEAELDGEVDRRAFGLAIARAATEESKAAVLAGQTGAIEQRIERLERRNRSLAAAHANGSMGEGAYRARVARLSAEMETTRALANATVEASRGLPADLLAAKGVNVTAIETLRERASELGGPRVAEIARDIGAGVGGPPGGASPGRPAGVGPGSDGPGDERPREADNASSPPAGGPPGDGPEESTRAAG